MKCGVPDPLWLAQSKFKRRRYDECIAIATELLSASRVPDKAVWLLKCAALTAKNWVDDTEMEEEGIAEALLDEHATADAPRPGTSLQGGRRGGRGRTSAGPDQGVRPVSASGRPLTGFARPGSASARQGTAGRLGTSSFQTNRSGTGKPLSALGRAVRLGTASMLAEPSGVFIDVDRLDLARYAKRPHIAKALCDFLLYHDHNPRKALELAAKATAAAGFDDWWWKARLGKCYYQLGLLRDAERQLNSALRAAPRVETALELAKVYVRLDQPQNVLECYAAVSEAFDHPTDPQLLAASARLHEGIGKVEQSIALYKEALALEPSCVEAMASLASHHFYSDQPEVAMRYYRRLLQVGPTMQHSVELWNNLGLCAFYASQHDMALPCMQRALALVAGEDGGGVCAADVWHNIGQIAIGIGDLSLGYQALKIAIANDPNHAESYTNLGVLELRRGALDVAQSNFRTAQNLAPYMYEAFFNGALLAYKGGQLESAYRQVCSALAAYPRHAASNELKLLLQQQFASLS
jgi:tetratricopeptide repeat protein 8|tara:strand:- start:527 stop:2098 length:1572 start_codon:yes stop_codon:yes gene_type:complete